MVEQRREDRRKVDRRQQVPAVYAGVERRREDRRSGRERRKAAARYQKRYAIELAKDLALLVVIIAALWAGLHYRTSSPADVKVSKELTDLFRLSGVDLIVVEGGRLRIYLEPQFEAVLEKGDIGSSPLLQEIAENYHTLTGRSSRGLHVYTKGKLAGKVKF